MLNIFNLIIVGILMLISPTEAQPSSLDDLIEVIVGDAKFRVPRGYLVYGPLQGEEIKTIRRDEMGMFFRFWISDKKYVLDRKPILGTFRPKEGGRDALAPDEAVADVMEMRIWNGANSRYVRPSIKLKNIERLVEGGFSFKPQFGLLRATSRLNPSASFIGDDAFITDQNSDFEALFNCIPASMVVTNPGCVADVLVPADGTTFGVSFSRNDIERWKMILTTAYELSKAWRAK